MALKDVRLHLIAAGHSQEDAQSATDYLALLERESSREARRTALSAATGHIAIGLVALISGIVGLIASLSYSMKISAVMASVAGLGVFELSRGVSLRSAHREPATRENPSL